MGEESESPVEGISKASCEVKIECDAEVDGVMTRVSRWTTRNVSELKGEPVVMRCPYCHGPIRLHFKGIADRTTEDHWQHLGKRAKTTDRYSCRAGEAYDGAPHMMSVKPVQ